MVDLTVDLTNNSDLTLTEPWNHGNWIRGIPKWPNSSGE